VPRSSSPPLTAAQPAITIPIHRPAVGAAELEGVRRVLESRWLGMGSLAAEFERRVGELLGVPHVVAVSSGSAALHLALAVLDLRPGDEVLVPSMTFVSCPQAVLIAGGRPVFCEVDPDTVTLDLADARRRITQRARAIMPVHYGGFACNLDEVVALAREHGLTVVEDAAHAFGSEYRGRMVGSGGDLACFSFDPVKNITCGEGGAVTTSDEAIAARLRLARNLGVSRDSWARRRDPRPWYYEAATLGFRYHLTDLNAAIGLAQLERFEELRARKRDLLRRYRAGLAGAAGVELIAGDVDTAFPFLCVLRVAGGRRDELAAALLERGIQAWVHFVPGHLQPAFETGERLPVTEALYEELLTLPLYAELTDAEVDLVVAAVRSALAGS
jgi:dTDP-4-amino-4,6-dideoxygalactose transaminase